MAEKKKSSPPKFDGFDSVVCSLQGGGALGAYQVGVLKALHEAKYQPEWFVGTSIGAINAGICAGNKPENRVERLMAFWDKIASRNLFDMLPLPDDVFLNRLVNFWSSQATMLWGQQGFFHPRLPSPMFSWHDEPQLLSYYDTEPLRKSLADLIDFDWLNSGHTRLSIGAVEITSGEMVYFDSSETTIGPEHIMASGALPPGFPAVEVDGKLYWDGGISSNTPVSHVLKDQNAKQRLCFMVHLFDSYGLKPTTMDDVLKRKKDIEFSSRFERILAMHKANHKLHNQINHLAGAIPKEKQSDAQIQACMSAAWSHKIALVRFLHKGEDIELSSKDYEFSKRSIDRYMSHGYKQTTKAIKKSEWNQPIPDTEGIVLYDMTEEYMNMS